VSRRATSGAALRAWLGVDRYDAVTLRGDLSAAATVAVVAVPQSMAYALIAGVDPVYGLYTAVVCAVVGSLLGSSSHLVTGPTNAIALMIAGVMKAHSSSPEAFYPTLFLLTFLVGVIQVALGLLKAGKVVNFVSHSVIVGFTAGAGVIIGLGQLSELLGVPISGGYHPLYEKVLLTLAGAGSANGYSCAVAAATVAVVLIARRVNRNIPGALLALGASACAAAMLGLGDKGVRLVGQMPSHLPVFQAPDFSLSAASSLFSGALAIAIVGLVEAIAIAKSIALSSGQRIDANREFVGQGLANVAGSMFSCFAASGSFTRSAVNHDAQARTRLAGALSGVLVALALVFCAQYARFIPRASLAAVTVLVAWSMVDRHAMRRIVRASRHDMTVMLITMGATVVMPDLERAILTGVGVSVLVHLWNTGEIKVKLLRPRGSARFDEANLDDALRRGDVPEIPLVHIEGDLYFGSSRDLQEKLQRLSQAGDAKLYILRLKRVNVIDVSAFEVLEGFIDKTLARGKPVLLCGVSPTMKRFLDRIGLTARVGEANVFLAEERLYTSSGKAYERALELLGRHGAQSA
jgi:sulfate permease, SulP family